MGDKLIVMVAIAHEETAKNFTSTEHSFELMDRFDLVTMSREIELSQPPSNGNGFLRYRR